MKGNLEIPLIPLCRLVINKAIRAVGDNLGMLEDRFDSQGYVHSRGDFPPPGSAAPVPDTKLSPAVVDASHQEASESLSKPANGHAVTPAPPAVQTQANVQDGEKAKKRQSFLTRTLWTFIMIGGFLGTHPCVYLMIDLTQ